VSRKPSGSVLKLRGKWNARVRWTTSDCVACSHVAHAELCVICGCEDYGPTRHEWRRVADPNTKAVAGELVREQLRKIGAPVEDVHPAVQPPMAFSLVATKYKETYVRPPVYDNGVKTAGMQDWRGVASIIDKILIPSLGTKLISDITYDDMRRLRDGRRAAPRLRGGRKISAAKGQRSIARVNREMSVARAIFNYAIDDLRILDRSPMRAGRGKSLVVLAAEVPRDRVLSADEEARLFGNYPARSVDYFIVAIDTGMREAEMFGLDSAHCDFTVDVIRLPWQITKSKKPRVIPMSKRVRALLKRRAKSAGPVFADLSPTIVRDDFIDAKAAAKVANFRMHDCRATVATRLLQAGLSEAEIAMMTGHRFRHQHGGGGDAPILRKHYLRLTSETLKRAATAIGASKAVN
jgi:integrase